MRTYDVITSLLGGLFDGAIDPLGLLLSGSGTTVGVGLGLLAVQTGLGLFRGWV